MQRAADAAAVAWIQHAHRWDYFITLTFAADVSETTARAALRTWLRTMARETRGHLAYAYVEGPQPDGGRWHFHVLLSFLGASPRGDLAAAAWRGSPFPTGRIEVLPCDAIGTNVVPYMIRGHAGWEPANYACPRTGRCAHRRCSWAPIGWK